MRIPTAAAAVALCFAGAAAFAQDVKVDFDKDANFGSIKTFATKIGTSWNNQISEKRITGEIEQTLIEKGWTKDEANPRRSGRAPRRDHERADPEHLLLGRLRRLRVAGLGRGGMSSATTTTSEFLVGTLVVDIFDAKSKQLLFRGTAQDEISDKPEKNVKKVAKASDKMFKDFPPGSKIKK